VEASNGEQIAAGLHAASVLLVRHLSYGQGQSLTSSLVLAQLDDDGPARISVLAAASGVSQPSMTELVGRLEREGLVTRFSDPDDGRATLAEITTSGRARRRELQRSIHDRVIELLEMLPTEDQATLSLAMRVASPLIEQLTQLAAQHPHPSGDRAPVTT
jgi:DNA-binding MarR family transcriptional regulator